MRCYVLSDEEWSLVSPFFPGEGGVGCRAKDNRVMVNAMIWIVRSGTPWRDLSECYGPWESVYIRFSRWRDKGIFAQILFVSGEEADMENFCIVGRYVKAHQHSAGGKGGLKSKA